MMRATLDGEMRGLRVRIRWVLRDVFWHLGEARLVWGSRICKIVEGLSGWSVVKDEGTGSGVIREGAGLRW